MPQSPEEQADNLPTSGPEKAEALASSEVLRHEGIDPDSGILVGTASDGVYVYFNSWGIIDGWGESLPPPIPADNYDM